MKACHRLIVPSISLAFLVACGDAEPTGTAELAVPASDVALVAGDAGFPVYGLGGFVSAKPGQVCTGPRHSEFDFWLGEWKVFSPEGAPVGFNSITSELDGCVVAEDWVGIGGVPGRSINTFDAETGQWHQTWVSANFSGHLRMSGGLDEDDRMVLTGERQAVNQGFSLLDQYTWTQLASDRVEQVGSLRVPAVGFEGSFVGIYERRPSLSLPLPPESPTTGCQPGGPAEQARQLDFWLGDWTVSAANGRALGSSTVTTDLSGCLVEERFSTPKGHEAVSFAYFDFYEQRWFRTYIDNRGERLELMGDVGAEPMVLSGEESGPGASGSVLVRVSLDPAGPDSVSQRFEVSRDGGVTWRQSTELVYQRD